MREGDRAALTRAFQAADVADYVDLGGAPVPAGQVPEPLIGALFSTLLGMRLPGMGTNYLKQETVLHAPARVGEVLTATVTVTRLRPDKHLVDLETRCTGKGERVIAEGRALVFVRDVGAAIRAVQKD